MSLAVGPHQACPVNPQHHIGRTLVTCGAEDSRVCAVTAAMADGTGLSGFAKEP